MNRQKLFVRVSLVFALILLVAAVFVGCGGETLETTDAGAEYTFAFAAVFADGTKEEHTVVTSCKTVGDALIAEGLIEGEEGPYGMYVKKVCDVVADYDIDGTYWALYVDGEYGMTGVEKLKCAEVENVEFRVSK